MGPREDAPYRHPLELCLPPAPCAPPPLAGLHKPLNTPGESWEQRGETHGRQEPPCRAAIFWEAGRRAQTEAQANVCVVELGRCVV